MIKLTNTRYNPPIFYVNPDCIVIMDVDGTKTCIHLLNSSPAYADETPEEILQLIKEAK